MLYRTPFYTLSRLSPEQGPWPGATSRCRRTGEQNTSIVARQIGAFLYVQESIIEGQDLRTEKRDLGEVFETENFVLTEFLRTREKVRRPADFEKSVATVSGMTKQLRRQPFENLIDVHHHIMFQCFVFKQRKFIVSRDEQPEGT